MPTRYVAQIENENWPALSSRLNNFLADNVTAAQPPFNITLPPEGTLFMSYAALKLPVYAMSSYLQRVRFSADRSYLALLADVKP